MNGAWAVSMAVGLVAVGLGGCAAPTEEEADVSATGSALTASDRLELPGPRLVNGHAIEDRFLARLPNEVDAHGAPHAAGVRPLLVNGKPPLVGDLHARVAQPIDGLTRVGEPPTPKLVSGNSIDDRINAARGGSIEKVVAFSAELKPSDALVANGIDPRHDD